jgi:hypothetical protein
MTDEIIQELWRTKDGIARDHGYDLDVLVGYLRGKERAGDRHVTDPRSIKETAEQGTPADAPTSRR